MPTLGQYAEYYGRNGFAVFPCKPRGKEPLTSNGCKAATTDVTTIKSWWTKWPDANIGLATGEPSGVVVLDIDDHKDSEILGSDSLRDYESEFGPLPETKMVITGSGGTHYYFRTDKDIRNRAGVLPSVDVRGTGGYVIAPPSIHPNGNAYEWEVSTEDVKIAPLPEDLYILMRGDSRNSEYGPSFELPSIVGKGQRNDTIFRLASSLQAKGLSDAALFAAVMAENQRVCDPPLKDSEVRAIIESALRYEKGEDRTMKSEEAKAKLADMAPKGVDFKQKELYATIFAISDNFERELEIQKMRDIAKRQKETSVFNSMLAAYRKEYVQAKRQEAANKTNFTDCPIEPLSCGEWIADDMGVRRLRQVGQDMVTEVACTHPILPVERYINVDDCMERVQLAFCKDRSWKKVVVPVSRISDRNKIVNELSDLGVAVTSGNSALLVQYLYDVLNSNLATIPQYQSIGRFGWMELDGKLEFSPYTEGLKFDGERSSDKNEFNAVREEGSFNRWKQVVLDARAKSPEVKILLAASCAAPCLKLIEKLPFFVHLWGTSGAGKTVALLVALSIWGDPAEGRLLRTFNSTMVGMEREAAFAGNIPIGFNELQVTKGRMDFDQIIYMLCEGVGKVRGNVQGGIDRVAEWRTVFLTNGEQPITGFSSGGGAKNRVFEIECRSELFEDPALVADCVRANYGHLGTSLINMLQEQEDPRPWLKAMYQGLRESLEGVTEKKQQDSGAMLLLGDKLFRMLTGADDPLTVEELMPYFASKEELSVGWRAYEYLCDWTAQNRHKFVRNGNETDEFEVWGEQFGEGYNIISKVFNDEMTRAGFNPTAVKSELKTIGKIASGSKGEPTRPIRINGSVLRCVGLIVKKED